MASAISHALVGGAFGLLAVRSIRAETSDDEVSLSAEARRRERLATALPWLCAALSVLPDADVAMHSFVPYSHAFGHRGAFHSLGFYVALTAGLSALPIFRGARRPLALAAFGSLVSHSLLDMFTNGGLGIALLWPLSDERHFFAWRPLPVSPLSVGAFLSGRGARILEAELPFALPFFLGVWWWTKRELPVEPDPDSDEMEDDEAPFEDDGLAVLEIEDSIDLHGFAPRDILDVVEAYLEAAWEKGFDEVRLIHGRGKGFQRVRVQQLLARHPKVMRYRDAPPTRGGWGATIAWLAPHDADVAGPADEGREI